MAKSLSHDKNETGDSQLGLVGKTSGDSPIMIKTIPILGI